MTHSLDGCDHAWVYSLILTGWLRPYLGSGLLCTLLWMAAPIPHMSCTWDISCISLCRFSGSSVFSCTCSCKAFHPSLSRASCFRGHLLHSNLSPFVTILVTPLPHFGGLIPGPVRSDTTWKHLHHIPLSMDFTCPEDISCKIPLKNPLFPLVRFPNVLLVPMGEIQQRGHASWHSVPVSDPRQSNLVKFFNKQAREGSFQLMNSIREHFPRVKPTRLMLSLILSP